MADGDFSPPLTPETPAATQASGANAAAAPTPTPVAAAAPPPAPTPTPEPAAASAPAAAAPATAPEPPKAEPTSPDTTPAAAAPTLLEKFDAEKTAKEKPAEAKPVEQPKDPAAVSSEKAEPSAPKLEPVEYKYELPEGMKMDDALKGTVHKAFDDFRADPSKGAQELLNLHKTQMQEYAQWLGQEQQRVFAETRQGWAKAVQSDPEMGGSSHQTTMGVIARMRDLFVPDKDRADFDQFLRVTGAGDHPAFLRMLMRAGRYYDEAQSSSVPANIKPPPTNGQRRATRFRDLYGQSAEGQ